jgi:hypothetical protein
LIALEAPFLTDALLVRGAAETRVPDLSLTKCPGAGSYLNLDRECYVKIKSAKFRSKWWEYQAINTKYIVASDTG